MKERLWKNLWVVLYVVLMGVLAIATFLEHAYGTTFVQTHIYHACWFCGLWGALAFGLCGHVANAGCGSASRSCGGMALF